MLRSLLQSPDTKLSRRVQAFYVVAGILLIGFIFFGQLTDTGSSVDVPVHAYGKEAQVIGSFPAARVVQAGELQIVHPSFLQRLLAPASFIFFDLVHACWLLTILIIAAVCFRKFDYSEPFTRQSLRGVRLLFWTTGFFMFAVALRQPWYISQVKNITGGQYRINASDYFMSPEFWVFVLLYRIVRVFRKGYELSLEQQYTV